MEAAIKADTFTHVNILRVLEFWRAQRAEGFDGIAVLIAQCEVEVVLLAARTAPEAITFANSALEF